MKKRVLGMFLAIAMGVALFGVQLWAARIPCDDHPDGAWYCLFMGNVGVDIPDYRHEVRCAECDRAIGEETCFLVTDCTANYHCQFCLGSYTGYDSHSYSSSYTYNSTHHFQNCTRPGCTVRQSTAHTFTLGDPEIIPGTNQVSVRKTCFCGYSTTVILDVPQ